MTTPTLRVLMLLGLMTAWAPPALAARLASVTGQADAEEVRSSSEFKLGEQTELTIAYTATKKAEGCSVQIRIYRDQDGGEGLVVNTVLVTNDSSKGNKKLTLPAGSYRIEVVATQAKFDVTVDN